MGPQRSTGTSFRFCRGRRPFRPPDSAVNGGLSPALCLLEYRRRRVPRFSADTQKWDPPGSERGGLRSKDVGLTRRAGRTQALRGNTWKARAGPVRVDTERKSAPCPLPSWAHDQRAARREPRRGPCAGCSRLLSKQVAGPGKPHRQRPAGDVPAPQTPSCGRMSASSPTFLAFGR